MGFRTGVSVVFVIAAVMLPGVMIGQATGTAKKVQSCASAHRPGRRIASNLAIVEFHVPRLAHVKKVADTDYVEYYVRFGPGRDRMWLKFMFGGMAGGHSPHDLQNSSITWTSQDWGCHADKDGTDWRGVGADGRRWRHISIPFGFAEYRAVPANAAEFFDKILDSRCCGKCPTCKK